MTSAASEDGRAARAVCGLNSDKTFKVFCINICCFVPDVIFL